MTDNPTSGAMERRYPGNSHAKKEIEATSTRPKQQKVVRGEVQVKPPVGRRILNSFRGDDGHTVLEHVVYDILIPSIKDMIVDAGKDALERAFFGSSSGRSSRNSRGESGSYSYRNNKTKYRNKYRGRDFEDDDRDEPRISRRGRSTHDFKEIRLETRGDAEAVLETLRDAIDQYDSVSVADLYDALDISTEPIDRAWGWTDLRDAEVKRIRSDLYFLDLPNTERLE